jgi:hypothetical protein
MPTSTAVPPPATDDAGDRLLEILRGVRHARARAGVYLRRHPPGCPCPTWDGCDGPYLRNLPRTLKLVGACIDGARPISGDELRHLLGSPDEPDIVAEAAHAD